MDGLTCVKRTTRYAIGFALASIVSLASNALAEKLTITQVAVSPNIINAPATPVNVSFNINKSSDVVLKVFDAADTLVWRSDRLTLPAGGHAISWSATDLKGRTVPPEAYFFVIEAQEQTARTVGGDNAGGEIATYDLTDVTGGEYLQLENIRYDSKTQKLTFVAPKTGRYNLRAGIARAFAIDTLINNRVVVEGEHEVHWDGYDASRVFNSGDHPSLIFGGVGYQLSSNSIIVTPPQVQKSIYYRSPPQLTQPINAEARENNKVMRANTAPNYYRSVNQSHDVPLVITLPKSIKRTKDDAFIVEQMVTIRIDLKPEDVMVMEAQRGEIVLFLDGQLIHDNEVSYYPYTFNWDPKIYDGKEHLLTIFVAGFAGNIGMSTLKIKLTPR